MISLPYRLAGRAPSRFVGVLACLLLVAAGEPPTQAAPAEIAVGGLRASLSTLEGVTPGTGLRLSFGEIPLVLRSPVNIVSPDWRRSYFTLGRARGEAVVSPVPGGRRIAFSSANEAVALSYSVDLLEGNEAVLDLAITLRQDVPAIVEHAAAYLSAAPLAGQPYEALTGVGEYAGVMPFRGQGTDPRSAMVAPPLRSLRIDSRLGAISVEASPETPPLDLFDARKVASATLQEHPIFWLGHLSAPLKPGVPFHSRIRLQVTPVAAAERPERPAGRAAALPIHSVPDARVPGPPDGKILPVPREQRVGDGAFVVNRETRIVAGQGAAAQRAARELRDRLREAHGVAVPIAPASVWRDRRNVIVVGSLADPAIRRWLRETGLTPVAKPEGYALAVTPRHVLLAGADLRGTLYGVFTLLQMAEAWECRGMGVWGCGRADGGPSRSTPGGAWASARTRPHTPIPPHSHTPTRVSFRAGTVRDWPALPVRAIHLLTDYWSPFLHRDLIRGILAPHKINTIVLECGFVKWDSHPELHVNWGMSKEEVRALLATARDYGIEVIPLVQTLGHMDWMFANNQHLDLAEDPAAKWAYCPSNPKVYDLIFDVLGEAIELFGRPRYFHIGHDEFTHRGKFAQEGPCKGKDATDLFVQDTLKLRDFLARHGARTMIWGDVLLSPGEAADAANAETVVEARRRRELLPKDILITDWHYHPAREYPSIGILRQAGFEVWAATWSRPANVQGFTREAARLGSGLLQTTWTGYYGNWTALRREFPQFWAYVVAAAYAWRPDAPSLEEISAAAPRRFLEYWPRTRGAARPAPGFTVDLAPLANLPWADTPCRNGWLGYGPEHDLSALPAAAPLTPRTRGGPCADDVPVPPGFGGLGGPPAGRVRLGPLLWELPANRKGVALAGALHRASYPEEVTVPIGRRAAELTFLMTAGWEVAENRSVGRITVRYGDGTELPVDLLYGWNVRSVHDPRVAVLAPVVWEGKTAAGDPLFVRAFTLWNPLPRKEVASVALSSAGTEAGPVLLAVSGVDP